MALEDEFKDKEKNMKLKLLWAQMEKKDLATTILKLENSAHTIHQSEFKSRDLSHNDRSYEDRRRSSYSEEKSRRTTGVLRGDRKRYSESYYKRDIIDDGRSGSRKRASLRRKHIDARDHSQGHERSKSAISVDSQGVTKHVEFNFKNYSGEDPEARYNIILNNFREKWFQD